MNSKTVLSKIMALLSKDEVALTYAKLADGTIVESPTFDVGEPLEVVSEDGTKAKAPDGEHELSLKDTEGNETLIKVITKDGVIVERENVELEDVKVEDIPQASGDIPASEIVGEEKNSVKMEEETEEVAPLPEDTDKEEPSIEIELKDMVAKLAYRIEEMEKKMQAMEKVKEEVVDKEADIKKEDDIEEMELPKLDGAPVEEGVRFAAQANSKNYGKKVKNSQSSFLSKLYK
jgi:hypothetical protein